MRITFKKMYLKHKALTLTLTPIILIVVIMVLMCLSTYIPKVETTDYNSVAAINNQYITSKPKISAHRARNLAPENTLAAFKTCFENNNSYKVDILEFDLHITADNKLILLHDDTIDRTSDCKAVYKERNVKPEDLTYAQLKKYNMGYNFEDDNGNYPYREIGVDLTDYKIISLEEVLAYLETEVKDTWKTELIYIIEIKNDGDLGKKATDILYDTLVDFNMLDRAIVGTFHRKISQYIDEKYPDITRSAGISETLQFYFNCMFGVNLSNKPVKYSVLQIPYRTYVLNLGKKAIIDYAHKYGIAVQYWTINDEDDIEYLASIGADAIISDDPLLAYNVINGL